MKHVLEIDKNNDYIALCIEEAVLFVAHLAGTIVAKRTRTRLVLEREEGDNDSVSSDGENMEEGKIEDVEKGACPVSRNQILWLGFFAFCTVLERRKAQYAKVRSVLRKKKDIQEAKLRKMSLYHDKAALNDCNSVLDSANWL